MKIYVKPEIKYENFVLSESIAACSAEKGWIVRGNQDIPSGCYAETDKWEEYEGIKAFSSGSCTTIETEGACYMILDGKDGISYAST